MDYVALQVKTSYTLLSSLNDIRKLVEYAKSLGYSSLAITDVNNMFGVMEFYRECIKNDIKPIIGIELEVMGSKILLYAITNVGYKNLIKLATIVSVREIGIDDIRTYNNDVLLVMPVSFYNEEIYNVFNHKYIGYKNKQEKNMINGSKVFISDVTYLKKDDYKYLDYLMMIKDGKVLGEYELNTHVGKHLLNNEEVKLLSDEKDILNTKIISEMCNVKLNYEKGLLPIFDKDNDSYETLKKLCEKGLEKRLQNSVTHKYKERLEYELSIIKKMGFCDYFLVVWDYVKYAKQNKILVGPGRGSAAGSLVSYVTGITDVDPIKYNLLFERFLNPERITMPDIDIDFDAYKREIVVDYVTKKYGEKKAVGIITFNTLAAKQAVRDVSRVLGINLMLVDEVTKKINGDLRTSYNDDSFKRLINSSFKLKDMYEIALKIEGLPRHVSMHAAGIVMSNKDIDEVIPLYKNELGLYVTGYSMNYLEELGLLKMDFLGLKNLTLIDEVINNIRETEKLNISFNNIPMNDHKTFKLFYDVDTDGIFQFESSGMKKFLQKLKVTNLEDLISAIALFRPGPMGNIDSFIRRREKKEKIDYLHPDLESILKDTYGIIVYQEQIMQIANVMAGYTYGEADVLRRAMSKKKQEILVNEQDKFIRGAIKKGYNEDIARSVYDLILKFANYGFNRSHSVAYVLISYKMAFLKVYFFNYFAVSLLNNVIGSDIKTKEYIIECRKKNVKLLLPSINNSEMGYKIESDGIRLPISIIHNVGSAIANEIIKARGNNKYTDIIDFVVRVNLSLVNKKVIISLIHSGCFDEFGFNKQTLVNNLDTIINYAELVSDIGMIEVEKPEFVIYDEYDNNELIINEFNTLGFYLSNHPVSKYRNNTDINISELEQNFDTYVSMVVYIDRIKEIVTKKNEIMAFVTVSDEYGNISVTLFTKAYNEYNFIKVKDIVRVFGRVERRYDKYQLIVNKLEILE